MLNAKMKWTVDPTSAINKLNAGMRNKAMRVALSAASAPMKEAVIASAPADAGNLKKSIKIRIRNYKNNNTWVSIIGASASFKRAKKTTDKKTGRSKIKKDKTGSKVFVKPSKYQRLVDKGTKYMTGRQFMSTAFRRAKAQFDMIARQKLAEQIKMLAQK